MAILKLFELNVCNEIHELSVRSSELKRQFDNNLEYSEKFISKFVDVIK